MLPPAFSEATLSPLERVVTFVSGTFSKLYSTDTYNFMLIHNYMQTLHMIIIIMTGFYLGYLSWGGSFQDFFIFFVAFVACTIWEGLLGFLNGLGLFLVHSEQFTDDIH